MVKNMKNKAIKMKNNFYQVSKGRIVVPVAAREKLPNGTYNWYTEYKSRTDYELLSEEQIIDLANEELRLNIDIPGVYHVDTLEQAIIVLKKTRRIYVKLPLEMQNMRSFTKEESEAYDKHLHKLTKKTGRKRFK